MYEKAVYVYYRGALDALIVYDISKRDTFENAEVILINYEVCIFKDNSLESLNSSCSICIELICNICSK